MTDFKSGVFRKRGIPDPLVYILLTLIALFIMVNVHEIGHTFFARLFGDNQAAYYLYRFQPNGKLACIGCNRYNEEILSLWGNLFVTLGGIIFSQSLAAALLIAKIKRGETGKFLNILLVVCVFDLVMQTAQGVFASIGQISRLTRVDLADFIWLVTQQTAGLSPTALKGILVLVLTGYLAGIINLQKRVREVEVMR